jgi:hypothetical protein
MLVISTVIILFITAESDECYDHDGHHQRPGAECCLLVDQPPTFAISVLLARPVPEDAWRACGCVNITPQSTWSAHVVETVPPEPDVTC